MLIFLDQLLTLSWTLF